MKPRLSALVATAQNRVIGKDNALPWRLPADLRRFKALTMGHPIIMGRKTYESIGRPLSGRINIIVTRQNDYSVGGAIVVASLADALKRCRCGNEKAATQADIDDECFVIGGADIFRDALPLCDRLYITEIRRNYEGDVYFPEFDRKEWREITREKHADESGLEYHFVVLDRRTGRDPAEGTI